MLTLQNSIPRPSHSPSSQPSRRRSHPRSRCPTHSPYDDEPSELEPAEPSEPVVAKATGMDAIAAPTPNATANAPTRPTHRA